MVEAVKLADDRSGDIVVRLYESLGGRVRSVLRTSFPVAEAGVVDLLERPTGEILAVEATGDGAAIPIVSATVPGSVTASSTALTSATVAHATLG